MTAPDGRRETPVPRESATPGPVTAPRDIAGSATAPLQAAGPGRRGDVVLRNVTKHYGATTAVKNLTLEVRSGEFLAVLGPSGSGKTTTMRIVGGFVRPDSGTVEISGRNVVDLPPF